MTRPTALIVAIAGVALIAGCGDVGEQLLSKDVVNTAAVQRVERKLDSLRAEIRAVPHELPTDAYTDGYLSARDSCREAFREAAPRIYSSSIRDTFLNYDGGLWKRVPR